MPTDNPFVNVEIVTAEFESASDRAAAIVGAAFLDELSADLLRSFFIKDRKNDERIFVGNGCLSTFSSRIHLCYRLGLLSKREYKDLDTIRNIRNKFAHQIDAATFTRQDIRDLCSNIEMPMAMVAPKSIPLSNAGEVPPQPVIEKADSNDPRAVFEESVVTYTQILAARVARATFTRRKRPDEFSSSVEIGRCLLDALEGILKRHEDLLEMAGAAGDIDEDSEARERYRMLVEVQRFCLEQLQAAHDANDV